MARLAVRMAIGSSRAPADLEDIELDDSDPIAVAPMPGDSSCNARQDLLHLLLGSPLGAIDASK